MKRIMLFITVLVSAIGLSAQTAFDALNYSRELGGGSARYMAMGGAFNALGGDFSTLSVNPAGIGIYRSNEFTFTPTVEFIKTTTDPEFDFSATDSKGNFNINNVGYVTTTETGNKKGLISYNVALGFNRLQNYSKSYRVNNPGSGYSLTDSYAEKLNLDGYDGAGYGPQLGYDSYLINESLEGGAFGSPLLNSVINDYVKDGVETGKMNEWLLAMGGNVSNVLYFGATLGLRSISHEKSITQMETFIDNEDGLAYSRPDPIYGDTALYSSYYQGNYVDGFEVNTYEKTSGFGMNLKVGFILKPLDFLRIGVAFHSPTYNWMNVNYSGDLLNETFYIVTSPESKYYGEEFYGEQNGIGFNDFYTDDFQYRVVTPYKVNLSSGMVIGKFLAIDVEGDIVGYDKMQIKDANGSMLDNSIKGANDEIKKMYKTAYNLRAGAELRFGRSISLRGGAAYYGSPYKAAIADTEDYNADYIGDRYSLSGGLGFRAGDFFLDLAYVHSIEEGNSFVYDDAIDAHGNLIGTTEMQNNRYMMTLGFKF